MEVDASERVFKAEPTVSSSSDKAVFTADVSEGSISVSSASASRSCAVNAGSIGKSGIAKPSLSILRRCAGGGLISPSSASSSAFSGAFRF